MQQNEHSTIDPRDIQRYLAKLGFDPGPIDGEIGKQTMEAVFLAVTTTHPATHQWPDIGRDDNFATAGEQKRLVAVEQLMMKARGFDPGPIDGDVGAKTIAAYAKWRASTVPPASSDPHLLPWIKIAKSYIGVHEGAGKKDNPTVVAMYARVGHPEVKHDEVPWCAAFVGSCLVEAGLPCTGTLWALDYARYGRTIAGPRVGAIATKKRNGGGHVFFVVDIDDKYVWGLGGNQSDAVNVARYPRSVIYSYNWPSREPLPDDRLAGAFRTNAVANVREA